MASVGDALRARGVVRPAVTREGVAAGDGVVVIVTARVDAF